MNIIVIFSSQYIPTIVSNQIELVFLIILIKNSTNDIIRSIRLDIRVLIQIRIIEDQVRDYKNLKYIKDDLVSVSLNKQIILTSLFG